MKFILKIMLFYSINSFACPDNHHDYISCKDAAEDYFETICENNVENTLTTGDLALDQKIEYLKLLNKIESPVDLNKIDHNQIIDKFEKDKGFLECKKTITRYDTCFRMWKKKEISTLWVEILNSPKLIQSINYLRNRLDKMTDLFIDSTDSPWYFALAANNKDNLTTMNKILRKLEGVVTSERSAKVLRNIFNEIKQNGLQIQSLDSYKVDSFNAAMMTSSYFEYYIPIPYIGNFLFGKTYQRLVMFNPQAILKTADDRNKYFTDWILAHELAHVYTVLIQEKVGGKLSKESVRDIEERHQTCLYHDKDSKELFGEDLADLIAFSALDKIYPKGTDIDVLKSIIHNFCTMQESYEEIKKLPIADKGHSAPKNRFLNLIKHNKHFQKLLGCKEDRLVCSIKM